MHSRVFRLIRRLLKLCIICSAIGQVRSQLLLCNTLQQLRNSNESEIRIISNEDNNISSNGIIEASFIMPSFNCCYKVQLLVNKSVTKDACENYEFPESDGYNKQLLHTEKKVCFENKTDSSISSYQRIISTKFYHVFTGCYGLKLFSYLERIVKKSKYVMSNYNQTDLSKPACSCRYRIHRNHFGLRSSDEYVEVEFTATIPAGVRILKVSVHSANDFPNCTFQLKYISTFVMEVANPSTFANYCEIISGENGEKTALCKFETCGLQNSHYKINLEFVDNRCRKYAIWKPKNCKWTIDNCTSTIVPPKEIEKENFIQQNALIFYVFSLLVIIGAFILVYRFRSRHINISQYESTEAKEDKCTNNNNTNIEEMKNLRIIPKNDKSNGIIVLYVRSSSLFSVFMTNFCNILKRCCHCDVYDWYAPKEWDNVAKLGPFDWVNKLRKMDCRIVWVDTTFSRALLHSHSINHQETPLSSGDFRDCAFPVILDMAKRNIKDPALQYQNHFIIRFDALSVQDSTEDPFADISPHVRYLMPRHFNQLCFDLSKQDSMMKNGTFEGTGTPSELQEELQCLMNFLKNI